MNRIRSLANNIVCQNIINRVGGGGGRVSGCIIDLKLYIYLYEASHPYYVDDSLAENVYFLWPSARFPLRSLSRWPDFCLYEHHAPTPVCS